MSTVETPMAHSQAAAAIEEQLRTMLTSISGFGFLTATQRRRLTASASIPDAFLLQVAQTLDGMPEIANAARVQPSELRDAVNFTHAFAPLASALQLYARGLLETIATRRADAGARSLRAYTMAKSFDRPSQSSLAVPQVRELKEALGRGRPRRAIAPPEPPPPAALPPATGTEAAA